MPKKLVIVESPAKAKTISGFLGKDYLVKSSFGHIRDLPKKGLNIDIEHGFEPQYEVSADKKQIVGELKKLAKDSEVLLASDEDREGEAIAWHLAQALQLDPAKTKRIVFHEITKPAIDAAIKHPRTINLRLVDAQQARRILDRLVGYELSPLLWKKVHPGLSAGRVQSVAVRLVVDREREIRLFQPVVTYKVSAEFGTAENSLSATLNTFLPDRQSAQNWLEKTVGATFTVKDLNTKPSRRSPSPPFTTSTLQQEASRRLGFSVRQTMSVAQKLYEAGHITYMRTDSTLLSNQSIKSIGEYIEQTFSSKYHHSRQFKTRSASAQEAHEAIRPTDIRHEKISGDSAGQKLYHLIWQRALASQMSEAIINKTELDIAIDQLPELFIAKGESLQFDGFMRVYGRAKEDTLLPPLTVGQQLKLEDISAKENFSRKPARYSEASLVRKLEELGIGRPSTYAPTIVTIQTRGYVVKTDIEGTARTITTLRLEKTKVLSSQESEITGEDRGKLIPTPVAELVNDFLVKYFPDIVNYDFTARVEKDFDRIALGKQAWNAMIEIFYKDFHPLIEKTETVSRQEISQARLVGHDPKTQQPIYARLGRFGPMLQRGETTTDNPKPEFAPLPAHTTLDSVTLKQALEMFKLPRLVGKTKDGQEILANIGRFGPYLKVGSINLSIKGHDPHQISLEDSEKLYLDKIAKEAAKNIKQLAKGIKVLNGPYGPYVTDGHKNARIPKNKDPETITQQEAENLLLQVKPGSRRKHKIKKTR